MTRATRAEAEAAVRTILSYIGDDPDREGLIDTPKRFIGAYDEWFEGYHQDPEAILGRTFDDVGGYDDIVLMRDIKIESHCEHHIAPMLGTAHVAYLPGERVVGISKLVRVVDIFAKRLQSQETLTQQIAQTINTVLEPRGVAVIISSGHQCLTTRGAHKESVACVTRTYLGAFKEDPRIERQLRDLLAL